MDIVFRPDRTRFASENSTVAQSESFFSQKPFAAETRLRADAHKWETVLHQMRTKRGSSLNDPVFDIHYSARMGGHDATANASTLRYAMVITVESKRTPDLHDQVLRTYARQLEALVPRISVPLRVRT